MLDNDADEANKSKLEDFALNSLIFPVKLVINTLLHLANAANSQNNANIVSSHKSSSLSRMFSKRNNSERKGDNHKHVKPVHFNNGISNK